MKILKMMIQNVNYFVYKSSKTANKDKFLSTIPKYKGEEECTQTPQTNLVDTFVICINTNTAEDLFDVLGCGAVIPTQDSKQVSGHVTHSKIRNRGKNKNKCFGFRQLLFWKGSHSTLEPDVHQAEYEQSHLNILLALVQLTECCTHQLLFYSTAA